MLPPSPGAVQSDFPGNEGRTTDKAGVADEDEEEEEEEEEVVNSSTLAALRAKH